EYRAVRHAEIHNRRQVMGGVMQSKTITVAESAIKFRPQAEIFTAKAASVRTGHQRQRPAYANGIAKFPRLRFEVLFSNQVFRDVPSLNVAGKNQLQLGLALLFAAVISLQEIGAAIVPYNFKHGFIGAVDVFKFKIKHRIDPVFPQQGTKTVLQPKAGEERAFVRGRLAIEVQL